MGYVRGREELAVILIHPETGTPTVPSPDEIRDENDPLVQKYRWAFIANDELVEETQTARLAAARLRPEDIAARDAAEGIEQATAAPGEMRATRARKSTSTTKKKAS